MLRKQTNYNNFNHIGNGDKKQSLENTVSLPTLPKVISKVRFQDRTEAEPEMTFRTSRSKNVSKLSDHISNIRQKKEEQDFAEMHSRIIKITKWDRFKLERQNIIDDYIKIKRR